MRLMFLPIAAFALLTPGLTAYAQTPTPAATPAATAAPAPSPSPSPSRHQRRKEKTAATTATPTPTPAAPSPSPSPTRRQRRKDAAATPTPMPSASPQAQPSPSPSASPKKSTHAQNRAAEESRVERATAAPGGGPGLVWVNSKSHVYHQPDSRYYGKTKEGKYATEAAAKAEGDHAAPGKD